MTKFERVALLFEACERTLRWVEDTVLRCATADFEARAVALIEEERREVQIMLLW